jgi:ATP/maltotriose-dependent transcriptional regulator MalT
VALDKSDDDLQQFFSYFVAAIQAIFPDAGRKVKSNGKLLYAHAELEKKKGLLLQSN